MSDDDIDMDELRRRVAANRQRHAADLERLEAKRQSEAKDAPLSDTPKTAEKALRALGIPEGIVAAARPSVGCEVCDRTFPSVDEAPWWTVETKVLCDEHMPAVILAHAERILRADPPRGIPLRQQDAREIPPDMSSWNPLDPHGRGWFLWGEVGRGKSYIAAALLKRAWMTWSRDRGVPPTVAWWPTGRLLQQIRATFSGKGAPPAWIEQLYSIDLLVLDDLGQERVTDWVRETLGLIVTERYDAGRKLIITSNYSLGGLARRFTPEDAPDDPDGARIASRIAEACAVVEIKGIDRRLHGATNNTGGDT